MNFSVPPDIINEDSSVDMAVQEGEDAALKCVRHTHRCKNQLTLLLIMISNNFYMNINTYN